MSTDITGYVGAKIIDTHLENSYDDFNYKP